MSVETVRSTAQPTTKLSESVLDPVTRKIDQTERYILTGTFPPKVPVVASGLLNGSQLSFLDFLRDDACEPYLELLFGQNRASAATMVQEFRKAQTYHYFGLGYPAGRRSRQTSVSPGLLDHAKSSKRTILKQFARRAYRGDPEKRGLVYWMRVAGLLWSAYQTLMALRTQSEKIKQQEKMRISQLGRKRAKCAERVQRHRAKLKAKRIAQAEKRKAELASN